MCVDNSINIKNIYYTNKIICLTYISITGCQIVECICNKCFDYKCDICNNILNKNISYLWDFEENYPTCDSCKYLLCKSEKI